MRKENTADPSAPGSPGVEPFPNAPACMERQLRLRGTGLVSLGPRPGEFPYPTPECPPGINLPARTSIPPLASLTLLRFAELTPAVPRVPGLGSRCI